MTLTTIQSNPKTRFSLFLLERPNPLFHCKTKSDWLKVFPQSLSIKPPIFISLSLSPVFSNLLNPICVSEHPLCSVLRDTLYFLCFQVVCFSAFGIAIMELIPGLPNDIARECMIRIPYKHFFKASAVCKRWKSDIESDEFHKIRKVSGFGRVVAVLAQAELNRDDDDDVGSIKNRGMLAYHLTVFEPETGVWERLPPLPGYSKGIPLFCQCIGVDHSLVVIGGWDPSNWKVSSAVYVYNFISGTWRRGADMPGPRRSFFASSGSDGEKMVFVAGGHDEVKNALRSALVYNVVADTWIHIADMAMERDECKGIFHGGMFHVIGGYSSEMQGQFCKSIESFEVGTWQWSGVKEEILQNATCPKSYIINEIDELIYNFAGDTVAVSSSSSDGATWKSVAEVPLDVRVGMNVMTWKGKTIAIGSMKYGGPHNCYMLEGAKWTRIATPEEYTGHVQTGCILEI